MTGGSPLRYRAIFLSDFHLGSRACKADRLLDFLRHTDSDYLYLVGDIIDGWRLKRFPAWRQSHNDVIQKILRKARKGTRVIYIPGNHDEMLKKFAGHRFGGIALVRDAIHVTSDGRRLLVLHGDEFDSVVLEARWLSALGDVGYELAVLASALVHAIRRRFGFPYWSLSGFLKRKVKNAVQYVNRFEEAVAEEGKRRGADGIVAGHIHTAANRPRDGILYCNPGDWVDSCTALVEHEDGRLEVLEWIRIQEGDPSVEPLHAWVRREIERLGVEISEPEPAVAGWVFGLGTEEGPA